MDKEINLIEAELESILSILPIAEAVYEAVKELESEQLMIVLGAVIDRWAAHHKLSSEETFEILDTLAKAQKGVHELIGPYKGDA